MEFRLGSAAFCGLGPGQGGSASSTHLCDAQGWVASFALAQDVRADAAATVAALRGAGLSVHLLSGDDAGAAAAVAREVGIDQVHAECTPDGKLAFVRALQAQGHRVAMVGDGLNDGPVLAAADVSFAFGQAVALAKSQADFVVLGEHLALVRGALQRATRTMRIVRQNLWWALAYNAACVPLAVAGWLPAWLAGLGMAASSLVVVLNALRLSAGDQHEVLS
jgi:Cu2+-exporting ATPase